MKNHLFNIHHKIKLKLDAICQEEGDMNVEEFMQVYESLRQDKIRVKTKQKKCRSTSIENNFLEDNINDLLEEQEEMGGQW